MTLVMFNEHLDLQDTLPKTASKYNCTKQLTEMTLMIFKKHLECHFAKACFEILFYNSTSRLMIHIILHGAFIITGQFAKACYENIILQYSVFLKMALIIFHGAFRIASYFAKACFEI